MDLEKAGAWGVVEEEMGLVVVGDYDAVDDCRKLLVFVGLKVDQLKEWG